MRDRDAAGVALRIARSPRTAPAAAELHLTLAATADPI
jgi:hypothetical protein